MPSGHNAVNPQYLLQVFPRPGSTVFAEGEIVR